MKTIPFLVLGTNFHFDEKTGQVVRPLFHSSFHTEFSFDEEDPQRIEKLLDFYAEQVCYYDHTVVINMVDGHIVAYKKLLEDNSMYVRHNKYPSFDLFERFDFDSSKFTDDTPVREE